MHIKFWQVGAGDAITIRFENDQAAAKNLFIDGGYLGTYRDTIKKELMTIAGKGEHVDLWIITHTDRDHIGGVEAFLKDPFMEDEDKIKLVLDYWFNWSSYEFVRPDPKITVDQGINLRDYLASTGRLHQHDIVSGTAPISWNGLTLNILSPDSTRLNNSKQKWKEYEMATQIAGRASDYDQTIESLAGQPPEVDTDPWNGGSIAFLLQHNGKSILFLADSFPAVVIESLINLGYSPTNKLKVNYMKLSHHGSKRNFDPRIFDYVECSHFIILANGIAHTFPNKWTLAQIITYNHRLKKNTTFYFNHDNPSLRSIFTVDKDNALYNFTCVYSDGPYLQLK